MRHVLLFMFFCTAAACDPGECAGKCLAVGGLYGPCTASSSCAPGLTCHIGGEGSICVPLASEGSQPELAECGLQLGHLDCAPDVAKLCRVTCPGGDAECAAGTVCDEKTLACVWP